MNIIDRLLAANIEKLSIEGKEIEITRLSEVLGGKFIVSCSPMTNKQLQYITEACSKPSEIKVYSLIECCEVGGVKFNDKKLMEKFGVVTPVDLIEKLFSPGEISSIYDTVSELSGYGKDAVVEIKN